MTRLRYIIFFALIFSGFSNWAQPPKIQLEVEDTSSYKINEGAHRKETYFEFDGKTGFLEFKSAHQIDKSFSISFWINPKAESRTQTLIMKGEGCPDGNPNFNGLTFRLGLTAEMKLTGVVFFGEGKSITNLLTFYSQQRLLPDFWQFVFVTFDAENTTWKVFQEGEKIQINQSFQNGRESFHQIAPSANATWKIGAQENYCNYIHAHEEYFNGGLKDIEIYDYQMSASEIQRKANSNFYKISFSLAILMLAVLVALSLIWFFQYRTNKEFMPGKYLVAGILAIALFFLFKPLINTNNKAYFGGDTWEYQSMAVNYSLGLGLQKFGGLATFDTYKFDRFDQTLYDSFQRGAGFDNVYRTPGYSLVLGVFYKILGVQPLLAKYFQLFLLCIIAGTLPLLGLELFERKGYYAGLFGGVLLLQQYGHMANEILTEVVFAFSLYAICWCWILFWKRKNLVSACVLGASIGLALLIKGSIIFLPFIVITYFIFDFIRNREAKTLRLGVFSFFVIFVVVFPWSIYASTKSTETVFLSTQTKYIIFDGNNEISSDGDWHPEWHKENNQQTFLYNTAEFQDVGVLQGVILFYSKKPELLFPNYVGKLNRAFSGLPFHHLMTISLLFLFIIHRSNKKFIKQASTTLYLLAVAFCFSNLYLDYTFILSSVGVILVIFTLLSDKTLESRPRAVLWILYVNFFILTALTYGNKRFIEVIDFLYILLALTYFLVVVEKLIHWQGGEIIEIEN